MENSGHSFTEGYSEGSEPIKLTDEQERIEKEAEAYADSIDRRGCTIWQGMYRGYKAGATAQLDHCNKLKYDREIAYDLVARLSEVIENKEQQLKEERNNAINECVAKYSSLWISRIVNGLKPTPDEVLKALESLKK